MSKVTSIGGHRLGTNCRVFITAEVGINHNGSLEVAKLLIDAAADAGCTAVKFQKRNPEKTAPTEQMEKLRQTPWGVMSYIDYRRRLELGTTDYHVISEHCKKRNIIFFASCWDEDSIEFIEQFDPPCHKIPSPCLTDDALLRAVRNKGKPVILSTGMSTVEQIDHALQTLGTNDLVILQCTSAYPTKNEELNLRVMQTYRRRYGYVVGYSGHETGYIGTLAAVALGSCYVERHITLDRNMSGSDHRASLDPADFQQLVQDIHSVELALGDGRKVVYESEYNKIATLRCKQSSP